ncbi:DoxX family protein [Peribacillus sp. SCS-37]|uniref:DoxX family protein n=1 Tax=Paraperibacillus esterisolvens TaxID=3115296 RepID=UPI003905E3EC
MELLSTILQIFLGAAFIFFGLMKFTSRQMAEGFKHFGLPPWFRVFTGIVELAAGALAAAGLWLEQLAAWGALIIVVTMAGAILTHLRVRDSFSKCISPILFLILGAILIFLNMDSF